MRTPDIVGLSMPDADITIDALAFVRYLRKTGYAGHITCGGPLATLVRHELLERHAGIDSVIRHDGELPLIMLAERIASGRSWDDIPGISTRGGDGPPSPVADPTPLQTRPMHADPLPRLMGVGTARLSASRGCPGRCPYCSPAALQREAIHEARKGGLSRREWLDAGVGKTRYRHYADLADEVADLYHRGGARFFQVVDENLLSGGEERAAAWLTGLMKELDRLGVKRTAWCLQADPATLTPEIIDLLEELGAIRVSVGIEGLTTTQLRALGRWGETTEHLEILASLNRRGIVTSFNSIIVHPESSPSDIARELEALSALPSIHFDVLSMAVYPGTQAYYSLLREGRVTGGMLAMRFEPTDIAVNRFRAALIRLRLEAMGRYGVTTFAHDVAINLALARRLGLPTYDPVLEGALASALSASNRARVRALETVLAIARTEMSPVERQSAMQALIQSLRRELSPYVEDIARVQHRLEGTAGGVISPSNLMFASAIAAGFVLCLSSASGCGGKTLEGGVLDDSRGDAAVLLDAGDTTPGTGGRNTASAGTGGVNGETGGTTTGGAAGATMTGGVGGTIIGGSGGMPAGTGGAGGISSDAGMSCSDPYVEEARVWTAVSEHGCERCPWGIVIDESGSVLDVVSYADGASAPDTVRDCYMEALSNQTFPCLSGEQLWYETCFILR